MNGLSKQEVDYRINNGMVNNETIRNSRSLKQIIISNTITLFNLIHIILFILVLSTGVITNATFIFAILFNTLISIYQEIKAKIIIDKLKITTSLKVNVVRDGKNVDILPNEILIDDILFLKQGDSLVVDAKIIETDGIEVDESIITGESDSVFKKKNDNLISGSIIISGSGYARVISINNNTYANNMIKEASKAVDDSSYLMGCINSILKVVTFLILPTGILLFITQFFYSGQTYSESILSSVAGIIGMIPDGLVLLTSVSLTVGVVKMASKKVIVQRLSGIELLACVDTLCFDKTGTITDGSMVVLDVINLEQKENINDIISNMVNKTGNITDKALFDYFKKENDLPIINKIPFSSSRKYSLVEFKDGSYVLGALEYISNKNVTDYSCLEKYVEKGYRIITLAKCKDKFDKSNNKVIAFVVLKDNVRNNAKDTLNYFKKQNVDIKIISGDDPKIVSNILKQLSIENTYDYISGNDLPEDYGELKNVVSKYSIFGRVTPYQKQSIVRALKEEKTVGYIGDGVNDILALREADCGIALASGISAARSVSEIVLTDSDFSVLTSIVDEGRRVVNNIERVASMYLIKTIYSFLISILCIVINHEYPFYPIQLTLISVLCVGIPSFFLAIEPNYNKVEPGFLIKVFRNALPSGICVFINVLFIICISDIFNLDYEMFRFVIVAITGYLNLRLLYNISKPLSLWRKILVCLCSASFYIVLLIFNDLFLINGYNLLSLVFVLFMIISDSYITDFFESLYDRFILKNIKRSKMCYEKK